MDSVYRAPGPDCARGGLVCLRAADVAYSRSPFLFRKPNPARLGTPRIVGFRLCEAGISDDVPCRAYALRVLRGHRAKKITEGACKQGVSTETLMNVWLTEKVAETSQDTSG